MRNILRSAIARRIVGGKMSRIVNIEKVLQQYDNYQSFTGHPEYGDGFDTGVFHVIDELENLPVEIDYKEIAKKLWTYICIIDDEKATYEELADSIGLSDDELSLCRRLEYE